MKGWHEKPEKCVRENTVPCKCCGSCEYGKLKQCNGMNVIIDYSEISQKFAHFYDTDTRIKVGFTDKSDNVYEIKTGTVSKTTGWKPVLMLMLRSNSHGSSYILSDNDKLLS